MFRWWLDACISKKGWLRMRCIKQSSPDRRQERRLHPRGSRHEQKGTHYAPRQMYGISFRNRIQLHFFPIFLSDWSAPSGIQHFRNFGIGSTFTCVWGPLLQSCRRCTDIIPEEYIESHATRMSLYPTDNITKPRGVGYIYIIGTKECGHGRLTRKTVKPTKNKCGSCSS